jgi:hypothetical protein
LVVFYFISRKFDANLFNISSGNKFDGSWLNDCVTIILFSQYTSLYLDFLTMI